MNIATLLRLVAADHAGQVALRLDEQEVRYAHLADTAARFAAHLRADGLAPGDRVGIFLPNALEYVPGLLGIWQAGAVAVRSTTCSPTRRCGTRSSTPAPRTSSPAQRTRPGCRASSPGRRSRCSPPARTAASAGRWSARSRRTTWCHAATTTTR